MARPEKILIVEDEEDIRDLLREILEVKYDNITTVSNGEQAIEKLDKNRYDIVLTDVMMPRKSGIDVLEHAKGLYDDIMVVLITGQASLETAIKSIHLRADDYLKKPFDAEELLFTVNSLLNAQGLKRENVELQKRIRRDRDRIQKSYVELSILHKFTKNLSFNFDVAEVYNSIFESLSEAVQNDYCAIYDIKRKKITVKTSVKLDDNNISDLKNSIKDFVLKNSESKLPEDEISTEVIKVKDSSPGNAEVVHNIDVILKFHDTPFGVLNVSRFSDEPFTGEDRDFLVKIADEGAGVFSRLQAVIESQKSKIQRLIEESPDGIIMVDESDDSVLINPAARKMILFDRNVLQDKSIIESMLNIDFDELAEKAENSGEPVNLEIQLNPSENEKVILNAFVSILSNPDGLHRGILLTLRDVTEEWELNRLKGEFISNISHELRTPASIIKEFIAIMQDEIAGELNKNQHEYVQIMRNNTERLLRLIENLLNTTRMEAGTLKLKKSLFDPVPVLKNLVESMNVWYKKSGVTLISEIPDVLPEMYADPDAITQILTNCLDNARKFSSKESEVSFKTVDKKSELCFIIKDSGEGMPKRDLDRIFDRFYRIESKGINVVEGTGLGLAIMKEFVDMHHGKIKVESDLGKGTTFFITIPVNDPG